MVSIAVKEDRQLIDIDLLDEHPDHDGIYREDIIDQIASELNGEWPKRHAILVRPVNDRFQVVSGHHRRKAATQAGIDQMWCDVEEMSDDEATIRLITDNKQGEKSPLQIGINVLKFESRSKGGRGKKGGLSEYARRVGMERTYLAKLKSAAEVALSKHVSQLTPLASKSMHLLAIHKLPEEMWAGCVDALIEDKSLVTVKDVEKRVDKALEFIENGIKKEWQIYLDPRKCASLIFAGWDPKHPKRMQDFAAEVLESLPEECAEEWIKWLEENTGEDSWDTEKLWEKRRELEEKAYNKKEVIGTDSIVFGDFREVSVRLEDSSVELIFTDPPYDDKWLPHYFDLAKIANRVLVDGGALICYLGHKNISKVIIAMEENGLKFYWPLCCYHRGGGSSRMFQKGIVVKWKPMLMFVKGDDRFNRSVFIEDLVESDQEKEWHKWQQGEAEAKYYIENLTTSSGLVFDPCCGGGTTAAACDDLGRPYLTCDTDENSIISAVERLSK